MIDAVTEQASLLTMPLFQKLIQRNITLGVVFSFIMIIDIFSFFPHLVSIGVFARFLLVSSRRRLHRASSKTGHRLLGSIQRFEVCLADVRLKVGTSGHKIRSHLCVDQSTEGERLSRQRDECFNGQRQRRLNQCREQTKKAHHLPCH